MGFKTYKSRPRNIQIKQYCYYTFIVHSDKVSYDVPCSISCNEIKLESNLTFSAWNIPGLKDLSNDFDLILPALFFLVFKLIKTSFKKYLQSLIFLHLVMLRIIF